MKDSITKISKFRKTIDELPLACYFKIEILNIPKMRNEENAKEKDLVLAFFIEKIYFKEEKWVNKI